MNLQLNKAHYPVTVLGPGRRVGLWFQGCTIRCFGCISRDTWPADPSKAVSVDSVLAWIRSLSRDEVEGVTISGGEPFDQPEALLELLAGLNEWRGEREPRVDILCYSGRPWSEIERDFPDALALMDACVPEPFIQGQPTEAPLRGSANQSTRALTALGRERYGSDGTAAGLAGQRARIQVEVDDEVLWMIGIPRQGDMHEVQERAAAAGIEFRRHSWLT